MDLEWDEAKRQVNIAKHGLDFVDIGLIDWTTATFEEDVRKDYGEHRYWAFVMWNGRLHVVTFVNRARRVRIINFRRANKKEVTKYGET